MKQILKHGIMMAVFFQLLNCSAYTHTGNPTASGVYPTEGMAASDHLPFGSVVTLPDGRELVVTDRFGGGYSDRLDIFMDSVADCWEFGRQWLKCRVVTPNA